MSKKLKPLPEEERQSADHNGRPVQYEKALQILESQDLKGKLELAGNPECPPEILFYLAQDPSPAVRRLIAENPGTPHQAHQTLTKDIDDEVRGELARKIARLVPDMSPHQRTKLQERTLELLEILAQDRLPRVRAIVSQELKSTSAAPKNIILKLAHDIEAIVSCPILEYSPLLNDDDLREIIAASAIKEKLTSIANRPAISEDIADAIAESLDIPAVAALLANQNAKIREDTLDMIARQAEKMDEWHQPLCTRPNLSIRTMRRISCFVAASLIDIMIRHNDLDAQEARILLSRTRKRIQEEPIDRDDIETIAKTVADLHNRGMIDDQFFITAIDDKKRDAIFTGLATLSGFSLENVRKIISERDGRKITALSWHCGLSMRTAYRLQVDFALVPPASIVNARDGIDYPMSEPQMAGYLEVYQ